MATIDNNSQLDGGHAQAPASDLRVKNRLLPPNIQLFYLLALVAIFAANPEIVYGQYKEELFGEVCKRSMSYIEGGFGALIAAVAGVGALIASAAGGFRTAWALLVVSIGAYIVRSYLTIWFGDGCGGEG